MLNTSLLQQKIDEARKNNVPESVIQERISEINSGVDAQDYQLPDNTAMKDGTTAVSTATPTPYRNLSPERLRMEQADNIKADLENGGKNVDKINSYYAAFQPTDQEKADTKTATDNQNALNSTVKSLKVFEDNFNNAGLRGKVLGVLPSGTGLSPQSSAFDAQRQTLAYQLAKSIGGQSGQGLSDKDFAHYLALVPARSDTAQEAKAKMDNIRSLLSAKYGGDAGKTNIKDNQGLGIAVENAVVKPVVNEAKSMANVATDLGAGAALRGKAGQGMYASQDEALKQAQALEQKAATTKDQQERHRLLTVADGIYRELGVNNTQNQNSFSPEVSDNPAKRGFRLAGDVAAAGDVIGNPGAIVQGITQPIRHPVDTAKAVVSAVKNPVGAAKAIIQNELDNSFKYKGTGLPKSGVTLKDGEPATAQQVGTQTVQDTTAGKVSTKVLPNPNKDMTARDKLAKEFATSLAVPNQGSVLKSEQLMQDALRQTTSNDPRGVARELETNLPKYSQATDTYAKQLDQKVGLQPLDENLSSIIDRVKRTPSGRANPELVTQLQDELRNLMQAGQLGTQDGTNFEKMNEARKYLNSGKTAWFKSGQPTGTRTGDLNALDWEASQAIKDIMSQGDKEGIFKDLLNKQHTALQVIPALSDAVLNTSKVHNISSGVRKLYEEGRNRIILRTAERGGATVPDITLADNAPAVEGNSATVAQNTAPIQASNKPLSGKTKVSTPFSTYVRTGDYKNGNPKFKKKNN